MPRFFNRLNYSFGNEDWKTEKKALEIQPSDRVVCITASGDRPLNLLVNDCQEIVSVDMNPLQNHLLRLKAAAMQKLDFQDYLAFLGGKESSQRHRTLHSLLPLLANESAHYWQSHHRRIRKGILYQGSIEKWTKAFSYFIKTFRKEKLKRLFSFEDIEKQKNFIRQEWDTPAWKKAFELFLHPNITRFLFNDPGLHEYSDRSLNIGSYIYERMNKSLEKGLVKESVLASLLLLGKVLPEGYPPYLTERGTNAIRKRLPKIVIVESDIISYLESAPESSIDAFSLSDVASYLDPTGFERLARGIERTAKPGARFCLRQFLSNHKLPKDLQPTFQRNTSLENQLEEEDLCFVYRFIAGKIQK